MKKRLSLIVSLVVVIGVLIAVVSGTGKNTGTQTSSTILSGAKDVQGQEVRLDPKKPTVLFFMAAWCTSCVDVERSLMQLAADPNVQIISVDVDSPRDTSEDLGAFQNKYGGGWPHVLDTDESLLKQYKIDSLDTVIIIKDGKIVHRSIKPSLKTIQEVLHAQS